MQPQPGLNGRARGRRLGLILAAVALLLAGTGGFLFTRLAVRLRSDPGLTSRSPDVLQKVLKRARSAEQAGDRATAVTSYRFVLAVGSGGDPRLEPYIAAARQALVRLGERASP